MNFTADIKDKSVASASQLYKLLYTEVLAYDTSVVTILKQLRELAVKLGRDDDASFAKVELDGYPLALPFNAGTGLGTPRCFFAPPLPDYRKVSNVYAVGCYVASYFSFRDERITSIEALNAIGIQDGVWCCLKSMVEYEEMLSTSSEKLILHEIQSIDTCIGRINNVRVLCSRAIVSKMISELKDDISVRLAKISDSHPELTEESNMQINISGDNNQVATAWHDLEVHSINQMNKAGAFKGDWEELEHILQELKNLSG